ncbi:MAG: MBL fold metallo-hydrolase [Chloroflexi bacterium]|nr:MBL fold metallo-hydrolase [Chloroflexota bacterium]
MTATLELAEGTYLIPSGSNTGLIVADGRALIVDAGLDADTARRVARALAELQARPVALLLTHAHADHFGGASAIAERFGVPVYAPALEAAIVENPYLEPQFLFSGAAPVPELLGKFTLAAPCRVSAIVEPGPLDVAGIPVQVVPLAGHAPNQVGYGFGGTLFCGDVFFPSETLAKHPIPFCADVARALDALQRLPAMPYDCFAPSPTSSCKRARPLRPPATWCGRSWMAWARRSTRSRSTAWPRRRCWPALHGSARRAAWRCASPTIACCGRGRWRRRPVPRLGGTRHRCLRRAAKPPEMLDNSGECGILGTRLGCVGKPKPASLHWHIGLWPR